MDRPSPTPGCAATRTGTVHAAGTSFTHRTLGTGHADGSAPAPLVALTHLGGTLDSWDSSLLDALAEDRTVIALGYRGVGGSGGRVAPSIDAMADDVIAAVTVLGHPRVDLLGMSMGGMVGQAVLTRAPHLVERAVLTSSGPPGGPGVDRLRSAMVRGTTAAMLRRTDPRVPLFFTSTPTGREAARSFLARSKAPRVDRERAAGLAVLAAQTGAVARWGRLPPGRRSPFSGPVWIVHGEDDVLVPASNAAALARGLPQADVTVLPDSGHGVVFQHHLALADRMREFFRR